ncbi:MAG: histidinol-phosphate transaminase [Firmicutes bacterium]|nr:histidinol-phosphate transaminase [Bacillota bacterium]
MRDLSENFRGIEPYTPGEQPQNSDRIKLNTNENPYPPSPSVQTALRSFDCGDLKLYPDPNMSALIDALAAHYGVGRDCVFAGVGSDDVLATCFMAFFNSGKPILFPDITYAFYDVWANLFSIDFHRVPLNGAFEIVKEDYYADNGGIVFPNPNAPTGLDMPAAAIEDILKNNSGVVVIVDEAYIDFGGESALPLIEKYDNLVVTRTFSKSRSMAGARVGFAFANPTLIRELNTIKNSYNSYTLSNLTMKLASAALSDEEYFNETVGKIIATREKYKLKLRELGFEFPDSKSNFIFATHPKYRAEELFEALKASNIYVRHFDAPRIDNYLRITVGTDEEMRALTDFFEEYMREAEK